MRGSVGLPLATVLFGAPTSLLVAMMARRSSARLGASPAPKRVRRVAAVDALAASLIALAGTATLLGGDRPFWRYVGASAWLLGLVVPFRSLFLWMESNPELAQKIETTPDGLLSPLARRVYWLFGPTILLGAAWEAAWLLP